MLHQQRLQLQQVKLNDETCFQNFFLQHLNIWTCYLELTFSWYSATYKPYKKLNPTNLSTNWPNLVFDSTLDLLLTYFKYVVCNLL